MALNNIAFVLASRDEPDLEKALRIASKAIELTTDTPAAFYETRGEILLRMQRYAEAVEDFTRLLAEPVDSARTHRLLSQCYEALGQPDLAAMHNKVAGDLDGVPNQN